eukprot:scaffold266712_cov19-Prasinocladus_malaysianus.AAC.2
MDMVCDPDLRFLPGRSGLNTPEHYQNTQDTHDADDGAGILFYLASALGANETAGMTCGNKQLAAIGSVLIIFVVRTHPQLSSTGSSNCISPGRGCSAWARAR